MRCGKIFGMLHTPQFQGRKNKHQPTKPKHPQHSSTQSNAFLHVIQCWRGVNMHRIGRKGFLFPWVIIGPKNKIWWHGVSCFVTIVNIRVTTYRGFCTYVCFKSEHEISPVRTKSVVAEIIIITRQVLKKCCAIGYLKFNKVLTCSICCECWQVFWLLINAVSSYSPLVCAGEKEGMHSNASQLAYPSPSQNWFGISKSSLPKRTFKHPVYNSELALFFTFPCTLLQILPSPLFLWGFTLDLWFRIIIKLHSSFLEKHESTGCT